MYVVCIKEYNHTKNFRMGKKYNILSEDTDEYLVMSDWEEIYIRKDDTEHFEYHIANSQIK